MKRKIIETNDGSTSIHIEEWNEQYHSKHGAIQEANHVFIDSGLTHFLETNPELKAVISILEIGFGTGLNAFITLLEAQKKDLFIHYTGVEAFPVPQSEIEQLNFVTELNAQTNKHLFKEMHSSPWDQSIKMNAFFELEKQKKNFLEIDEEEAYSMIYFDAFGPRVQPELWTETLFRLMFKALRSNGILVTYCAQGNARRAMQNVGFNVERIAGPPGKRHMLRATKL